MKKILDADLIKAKLIGRSSRFGATVVDGGVNFSLFSRTTDGNLWRRWIDTALDSPHDIVPWQTAPTVTENTYRIESRSVVMLFTRAPSGMGPSMSEGPGS